MRKLVAQARESESARTFARFLATGLLNTAFGYLLFLIGILLRLSPELALAVATALGALFNYFTTARIVFGHRAINRLPIFVTVYGVIYGINALAIRFLVNSGLGPAMAQALLTPFMAITSFLLFRNLVFRPSRQL